MELKIFLLISIGILFLFAVGGLSGTIWLPTRKKDYERIAQLMNLRPGVMVYDFTKK